MSQALVERASRFLGKDVSRRRFLQRVAVVGSALLTAPLDFILRPNTAYAAVCGPADQCNEGYTVMCCTVNRGINRCPPNMFVGGWWRADGGSLCCDANGNSAPRYIIDCHPKCECDSTSEGNFCTCHNCICRCGTSGCDRRRICCNYFRYGQCRTDIAKSGPVACRVITCVPPYQIYDDCGTTIRYDNFTADHSAECLVGPCR